MRVVCGGQWHIELCHVSSEWTHQNTKAMPMPTCLRRQHIGCVQRVLASRNICKIRGHNYQTQQCFKHCKQDCLHAVLSKIAITRTFETAVEHKQVRTNYADQFTQMVQYLDLATVKQLEQKVMKSQVGNRQQQRQPVVSPHNAQKRISERIPGLHRGAAVTHPFRTFSPTTTSQTVVLQRTSHLLQHNVSHNRCLAVRRWHWKRILKRDRWRL